MYFEMETTYDQPTVLAFQRILNQTVRARRIRLVRICSFLVAGLSLVYALIWFAAGVQAGVTLVPAVSGLLMCGVFLAIGLLYETYLIRLGRHLVNQTPVTIRYSFHESGYTTGKGKDAVHSPYRVLRSLCCDSNYDVLMLDRRHGFIIDHQHFLQGDPGRFRAFLEDHTGKIFQIAQEQAEASCPASGK